MSGGKLKTVSEVDNAMDAAKQAELQVHVRAIAALLYAETTPEQVATLADIEETVRAQLLAHVSPEIDIFLSKRAVEPPEDAAGGLTASLDR